MSSGLVMEGTWCLVSNIFRFGASIELMDVLTTTQRHECVWVVVCKSVTQWHRHLCPSQVGMFSWPLQDLLYLQYRTQSHYMNKRGRTHTHTDTDGQTWTLVSSWDVGLCIFGE